MRTEAKINDTEFKRFRNSVVMQKRYKADRIKNEERRREQKLNQYRHAKLISNSVDYKNRKNLQKDKAHKVQSNISTLETIEGDMLSKLQNTRANVEKANKEYMSALDTAYSSQELRIKALKNKLDEKRNKFMVTEGYQRNASQSKISKHSKE